MRNEDWIRFEMRDSINKPDEDVPTEQDKKNDADYNKAMGGRRDIRPPLGLVPRKIRTEQRITEIVDAMSRYASAGKPVPAHWIQELQDLWIWYHWMGDCVARNPSNNSCNTTSDVG